MCQLDIYKIQNIKYFSWREEIWDISCVEAQEQASSGTIHTLDSTPDGAKRNIFTAFEW